MKHTPGPWKEYNNVAVLGANDDAVCMKPDDEYKGSVNWQANARLIAAAPDMLEALRMVEKTGGAVLRGDVWDTVLAAIRKATNPA